MEIKSEMELSLQYVKAINNISGSSQILRADIFSLPRCSAPPLTLELPQKPRIPARSEQTNRLEWPQTLQIPDHLLRHLPTTTFRLLRDIIIDVIP